MQNSRHEGVTKLSREILGFLGISFLISLFLFAFLYWTAISISEIYFDTNGILPSEFDTSLLYSWVRNICSLAVFCFFIALFLTLLGQKFSYLREIIRGVDALRINRMDYEVLVEGHDELTELAERINYLSRTQRKLAEQERCIANERRQWIRALSHDIRNPLTAMLSYTEYLQKQEEPGAEELKTYLELVYRKTRIIKELTDRLLENSERKTELIEDGHMLMLQLAQEWADGLDERFELELDLHHCPKFSGHFDLSELHRIFDNLASNIEKYADDAKTVSLRVFKEDEKIHILQENAVKTEEGETESHGIGLSSVRHIVAAYGGDMEITEHEGRFQIRLTLGDVHFGQCDQRA